MVIGSPSAVGDAAATGADGGATGVDAAATTPDGMAAGASAEA